MAGRIDSIAMINLSLVTTDDLQWKYETGSSIASGTGKQKTYSYRNGVETPIGDIEFSVWCAAAEHVIKRDGLCLLSFSNTKGKRTLEPLGNKAAEKR